MICFISGGAKNGKTSLAQEIALKISSGKKHYFVATMIPVDDEDHARIRLHIEDRAGMDFETIECGRNLLSCLQSADNNATFLLDSLTALLMNELFDPENNYEIDENAANRCTSDMEIFLLSVKNAVVVSDYIYSDANRYDETTEMFRRGLAQMDRKLAKLADVVIEMSGGQIIVHKGVLPL